jgi:hypothetical protein
MSFSQTPNNRGLVLGYFAEPRAEDVYVIRSVVHLSTVKLLDLLALQGQSSRRTMLRLLVIEPFSHARSISEPPAKIVNWNA